LFVAHRFVLSELRCVRFAPIHCSNPAHAFPARCVAPLLGSIVLFSESYSLLFFGHFLDDRKASLFGVFSGPMAMLLSLRDSGGDLMTVLSPLSTGKFQVLRCLGVRVLLRWHTPFLRSTRPEQYFGLISFSDLMADLFNSPLCPRRPGRPPHSNLFISCRWHAFMLSRGPALLRLKTPGFIPQFHSTFSFYLHGPLKSAGSVCTSLQTLTYEFFVDEKFLKYSAHWVSPPPPPGENDTVGPICLSPKSPVCRLVPGRYAFLDV